MRIFHLLILFLCIHNLSAQSRKILKVVDLESGNPISNLYVYCEGASASSNSYGEILMSELEKCKELNFQHPSYADVSFSIEQIEAKNYVIYLEESFMELSTIDLSFNKWEQKREETPISISSISKKDIDFQNPQTAADLLAQSGKVFIQKSQLGGGSPMIRGFSTSRVLLVVDGVRMNTAIFREGNVQNVISLDANAIDNTEIVFGPGSVIYGSDAIGGVMNFTTLKPQFTYGEKPDFALNYLLRYTSANAEKTGHFHFNWSNDWISSVTSFTFSDYDDQIMGSFGPDEYLRNHYQSRINGRDSTLVNSNPLQQIGTAYSQFNVMQKLRIKLNSDSELNYGFHYSTTSDIPRYDRLTLYSGTDSLTNAEWYYGPQNWMMHNVNYSLNSENKIFDKLKATVACQRFEESRNDRRSFSNNLRTRTETVDALSASLDFEKVIDYWTRFYYGFENVYNYVGSSAVITNILDQQNTATNTRYPDGSTWNYSSAYFSFTRRLNKNLTWNGGARFNSINLRGQVDTSFFPLPTNSLDNNFLAVNGSMGLSYVPSKKWQFNLNASNGFRAPNIDDVSKIFDSSPGNVVLPNPDLKPEVLYALDFGLMNTSYERLQFEFGAYYSHLTNALGRENFALNGADSIVYDGVLSNVQAIQNIGSANIWGVQAALQVNLMKDLDLRTNVHYNNGETTDGQALRHVSPLFGATHVLYKYRNITFDLYSIYNGPVTFDRLAPSERDKPQLYASDENGNPYSPAWLTLNLKMEVELSKKLKFQLGLENINDVRYRPYSSGIAAMGKNVTLSIRGVL